MPAPGDAGGREGRPGRKRSRDEDVRRLVRPPSRSEEDGRVVLTWLELSPRGDVEAMMWVADTKAESRALEAFYEAAMQVDWDQVDSAAEVIMPAYRGKPKIRREPRKARPVTG